MSGSLSMVRSKTFPWAISERRFSTSCWWEIFQRPALEEIAQENVSTVSRVSIKSIRDKPIFQTTKWEDLIHSWNLVLCRLPVFWSWAVICLSDHVHFFSKCSWEDSLQKSSREVDRTRLRFRVIRWKPTCFAANFHISQPFGAQNSETIAPIRTFFFPGMGLAWGHMP